MDKHSEVEVKYEATGLDRDGLVDALTQLRHHVREATTCRGVDTFYRVGENVMRHRVDVTSQTSCLTVKKRKSRASTFDRHEVDLPLGSGVEPRDVDAFLRLAGFTKEALTLYKESFICHVQWGKVDVCLALYWVTDGDGTDSPTRTFLELEAEKDSDCTVEEARVAIEGLGGELARVVPLQGPLNQGLYEMYSGRSQ